MALVASAARGSLWAPRGASRRPDALPSRLQCFYELNAAVIGRPRGQVCCAEPIWRSTAGRVETFQLDPSDDDGKIREDAAWLGDMIRLWLNEEWSELEIHRRIGKEVARVFANARLEGCHEIQDVLVALTTELQAFDFYDSFTDAFSVSNKCVELLMMRAGIDCGCSTEADRTCIPRFEAALAEERRGQEGSK